MTDSVYSSPTVEKILLIRMLTTADVCAIGLPVIRYFQQQKPQAELHVLTFADGAQLIKLAEPNVFVKQVTQEQWPDDFFLAMESFLGIAEDIIGEAYSQVINLDTAFMPCFLARFLMDAGEPVSGNYLNMSVQQLIEGVQAQSLRADYVNSVPAYMASSFANMHRWYTAWWLSEANCDGGYPEFYLTKCCGLNVEALQQSISVSPDKRLSKKSNTAKVLALCFEQSEDGYLYPFAEDLKKGLEQKGFVVWSESDAKGDVRTLLKMLAATDLLIAKPSGIRWYAQAVNCPILLISGSGEPATLMPDFATDVLPICPKHGPNANQIGMAECNCDKAADLVESIESVFAHFEGQ